MAEDEITGEQQQAAGQREREELAPERGMRAGQDRHHYHADDLDLLGAADDDKWSIRCLDVHKRLAACPCSTG